VREVRGLRIGFLAFNGVGESIDRAAMATMIGRRPRRSTWWSSHFTGVRST
jgi:hypothetical protein